MSQKTPITIENTIPVLAVADVRASIRFYCDVLKFQCDWTGDAIEPQIGSVSRDGHAIMLQHRGPVAVGTVWIGISCVKSLWETIRSIEKIEIVQKPTNHCWALDLKIKDPDGNTLWFGSEPLTDVPFEQELSDDE